MLGNACYAALDVRQVRCESKFQAKKMNYLPVTTDAIRARLQLHSLFNCLSEEQLQRVAHKARVRHVEEGEYLFEQGDPADHFFLLLSGQIKLYRLSPSGDEKVIEVVMPGGTFAEALMFLKSPRYPVGSQALRPSELVAIDAHDFAAMLRDSVETCFLLMADMSQRLRGLLREIDDLSLHSASCRVAGYLLSQAISQGDDYELDVAKRILASRLSVKPETFSRILKDLSTRNIVRVEGSRITIQDRRALQAAADTCALPQDRLAQTFAVSRND